MKSSEEYSREIRELRARLAELEANCTEARTREAGLEPGEVIQEVSGSLHNRRGAVISARDGSVRVHLLRSNGTVGRAEAYFWNYKKLEPVKEPSP